MVRFWASVVLLYRAGGDAPELLERLLTRSPGLAGVDYFDQLEASIDEWGAVSLF